MIIVPCLCLSLLISINSAQQSRRLVSSDNAKTVQYPDRWSPPPGSDTSTSVGLTDSVGSPRAVPIAPPQQLLPDTSPLDSIIESTNTNDIITALNEMYLYHPQLLNFNVYVHAALQCRNLHQTDGYKIVDHLLLSHENVSVLNTVTFDSYYQFFDAIFECTDDTMISVVLHHGDRIEHLLNQHKIFHFKTSWIYETRKGFVWAKSEEDIINALHFIYNQAPTEFAYYVPAAIKCAYLGGEGTQILQDLLNNQHINLRLLSQLQLDAVFRPLMMTTTNPDGVKQLIHQIISKCASFGNNRVSADQYNYRQPQAKGNSDALQAKVFAAENEQQIVDLFQVQGGVDILYYAMSSRKVAGMNKADGVALLTQFMNDPHVNLGILSIPDFEDVFMPLILNTNNPIKISNVLVELMQKFKVSGNDEVYHKRYYYADQSFKRCTDIKTGVAAPSVIVADMKSMGIQQETLERYKQLIQQIVS